MPFLRAHILDSVESGDAATAHRVIDACAVAPGLRRTGRRTLEILQAREISELIDKHAYSDLHDLTGDWLPGPEAAPELFAPICSIAALLRAADAAELPYHRKQNLQKARDRLHGCSNALQGSGEHLARAMLVELPRWRAEVERLLGKAERSVGTGLPNPFRANTPLSPENGRRLFRGRESIVRNLESLLFQADEGCSIALLGPRRIGKSSLLRMLPIKLPEVLCVFFDLQGHPVSSPAALLPALARRCVGDARAAMGGGAGRPPELPEGPADPWARAAEWLGALNEYAADRPVLICIDEFERLEQLFAEQHADMLRLMGLFRYTIQHHSNLRLLVSGVSPFDELSSIWDDHFVNVRELSLGPLSEAGSLSLLTRPVDDFPDDAVSEELARAIHERTGGRPYLLQVLGSLLIQHLNDEQRRVARGADLEAVVDRALDQVNPYFRDTCNSLPEDARTVLEALARGQQPEMTGKTRRRLRQRCLINDDDSLSIPMMAEWMHREVL